MGKRSPLSCIDIKQKLENELFFGGFALLYGTKKSRNYGTDFLLKIINVVVAEVENIWRYGEGAKRFMKRVVASKNIEGVF